LPLETAGACRAGITPARPAVYKPPVGAQVASPQSPILRWSTSRLSEVHHQTRGSDKSPLLIARLLLLATNRLLLLTQLSPFARPATGFSKLGTLEKNPMTRNTTELNRYYVPRSTRPKAWAWCIARLPKDWIHRHGRKLLVVLRDGTTGAVIKDVYRARYNGLARGWFCARDYGIRWEQTW